MRGPSLPVMNREVLDYTIISTVYNCPRLACYRYALNRRIVSEDLTSINFGSAYHAFREMLEDKFPNQQTNILATPWLIKPIIDRYENPPSTHKKAFLDKSRLAASFRAAEQKRNNEIRQGITVLHHEISFDLSLPSGRRYGGRYDQVKEWNKKLWITDFKSKSWMLSDAATEYELNEQMSGYIWSAIENSGEDIEGGIFEVMYNTLKQGPEVKPIMTTRVPEQLDNFIEWAENGWDLWERYSSTGHWPMNSGYCFRYNKKCVFHDSCSKGAWPAIENHLEDNTIEKVWDFSRKEEVLDEV